MTVAGEGAIRPGERLIYLDNLRALCMLLGVLVHATTLGGFGLLEYVTVASDWFRMATFFTLSGLFAMMLLARWKTREFLTHRLRATVIPFLTTLILLNPVTIWLVYNFHNRRNGPWLSWQDVIEAQRGQLDLIGTAPWHMHLWFLVSLTVFVLLAPVTAWAIRRLRRSARLASLCSRVSPAAWPVITALGIAIVSIFGRAVVKLVIEPAFGPVWLLTATASYWAYFAAGMLFHSASGLFRRVHVIDIPSIALLALLIAASTIVSHWNARAGDILLQFTSAFGRAAVTFAALFFARAWLNQASRGWKPFVSAIYTLYLVHYFLIYFLAMAMIRGEPTAWHALGISAIVVVIGLSIHRWLIEPFPAASFLFNGKPFRRRNATS